MIFRKNQPKLNMEMAEFMRDLSIRDLMHQKERELPILLTTHTIKEIGKMEKCMEKEFSIGMTEIHIMVNTSMEGSMASENFTFHRISIMMDSG